MRRFRLVFANRTHLGKHWNVRCQFDVHRRFRNCPKRCRWDRARWSWRHRRMPSSYAANPLLAHVQRRTCRDRRNTAWQRRQLAILTEPHLRPNHGFSPIYRTKFAIQRRRPSGIRPHCPHAPQRCRVPPSIPIRCSAKRFYNFYTISVAFRIRHRRKFSWMRHQRSLLNLPMHRRWLSWCQSCSMATIRRDAVRHRRPSSKRSPSADGSISNWVPSRRISRAMRVGRFCHFYRFARPIGWSYPGTTAAHDAQPWWWCVDGHLLRRMVWFVSEIHRPTERRWWCHRRPRRLVILRCRPMSWRPDAQYPAASWSSLHRSKLSPGHLCQRSIYPCRVGPMWCAPHRQLLGMHLYLISIEVCPVTYRCPLWVKQFVVAAKRKENISISLRMPCFDWIKIVFILAQPTCRTQND